MARPDARGSPAGAERADAAHAFERAVERDGPRGGGDRSRASPRRRGRQRSPIGAPGFSTRLHPLLQHRHGRGERGSLHHVRRHRPPGLGDKCVLSAPSAPRLLAGAGRRCNRDQRTVNFLESATLNASLRCHRAQEEDDAAGCARDAAGTLRMRKTRHVSGHAAPDVAPTHRWTCACDLHLHSIPQLQSSATRDEKKSHRGTTHVALPSARMR